MFFGKRVCIDDAWGYRSAHWAYERGFLRQTGGRKFLSHIAMRILRWRKSSRSNVTSTGWVETWDPVTGATSYNVYVNGTKVNTSPITSETYTVTGEPNKTYSVTVTAVNAAEIESAPSVGDSVLTAPAAPTGLTNRDVTSDGWTSTWDAVPEATSYNYHTIQNWIAKTTEKEYFKPI